MTALDRYGRVSSATGRSGRSGGQTATSWQECWRLSRDDATIRPPIPSAGRLFALGGVYTQHIRERGQPLNSVPSQWVVPETAVVGPGEPIVVPNRVTESVVPAVELGVVIGRGGKDIEERDAFDHVAGYTVVNDVTARTEWPGPMAYKLLDTFSPCGPHIMTADEVDRPMRLEMSLDHGGARICEGSSASMRFTISFIVSYLSTIIELRPGDVISTGDPGRVDGVLRDGESVMAAIQSVGELTNPVSFK